MLQVQSARTSWALMPRQCQKRGADGCGMGTLLLRTTAVETARKVATEEASSANHS